MGRLEQGIPQGEGAGETAARPTPEQRTAAFWNQQTTQEIAARLKPAEGEGMVIAIQGTDRKVRVANVQAFEEVGEPYVVKGDVAIAELNNGDLWSAPTRQIAQSLAITPWGETTTRGSCTRIRGVEYYDPTSASFVPELRTDEGTFSVTREGDTAKFFGLEKGDVSQLKFLDDTDTLYLVTTQRREAVANPVTPREADDDLLGLLT